MYVIITCMHLHSTQSTLLLLDHLLSSTMVLKDRLLCHHLLVNVYARYNQPSYWMTVQVLEDALCQLKMSNARKRNKPLRKGTRLVITQNKYSLKN